MEGTYPLRIDGVAAGEVKVTAQGALTAFDVTCKPLPGIVRVSVYGGGREGYLGVLAPEDGLLTLHKKLSRAALRGFPAQIECAERAGARPLPEPTPQAASAETENAKETEKETEAADSCPVPLRQPSPAPETEGGIVAAAPAPSAEPAPPVEAAAPQAEAPAPPAVEPVPETVDDLYWYSSPDGVLVCFDGAQNLIALPEGDPRIPPRGGVARTVEGRRYVVFRTKNGRLVY